MEDKKYNGWSNYATWRVNLECVDPVNYEEAKIVYKNISELADAIKENIELLLGDEAGGYAEGLNHDYAMEFLSDVNWYEIAESVAEDYPELIETK